MRFHLRITTMFMLSSIYSKKWGGNMISNLILHHRIWDSWLNHFDIFRTASIFLLKWFTEMFSTLDNCLSLTTNIGFLVPFLHVEIHLIVRIIIHFACTRKKHFKIVNGTCHESADIFLSCT